MNTNIKTYMPQVSDLSKPDIIIQIEDKLCVVSLLMKIDYPSIMFIGQSFY